MEGLEVSCICTADVGSTCMSMETKVHMAPITQETVFHAPEKGSEQRQIKETNESSDREESGCHNHASTCKHGGICQHHRMRSQCKDCGGRSICHHYRVGRSCKVCRTDADEDGRVSVSEVEA